MIRGFKDATIADEAARSGEFRGESGVAVAGSSVVAPSAATSEAPAAASPSPREALAAALAGGLSGALATGDHGAARIALAALQALLDPGPGSVGPVAPVVDLNEERRRRGG
jgi:hypothetical protein